MKHDEKDNKRTSGFFLLSLKKWGEEGKEPEWGGRKKGGMGRKEEDDYFFRKADLKCNHSASLSEEMDMTEREEKIFGLDFSRG